MVEHFHCFTIKVLAEFYENYMIMQKRLNHFLRNHVVFIKYCEKGHNHILGDVRLFKQYSFRLSSFYLRKISFISANFV